MLRGFLYNKIMPSSDQPPLILVVSGGIGASGEQLVHTVLAQFPPGAVRVRTAGNIRTREQIVALLEEAQRTGAMILHTLVEPETHAFLMAQIPLYGVQAFDLMGPLLDWIAHKTGQLPKGEPGLYRQLNREYFDRVSAIDFTMAHDDGKNPDGWPDAEIMLVGVSRVGKTPLSLYLAVLGWKVANYPLVPQLPVPEKLFALDARRVIGLTIHPDQLLQYRLRRQRQMGAPGLSPYVDPQAVSEEVQQALRLFRQSQFTIVDMTDKTIELGADEIIRHLS